MRQQACRGEDGFSLLELMVVIAILSLAAAIAGPTMIDHSGSRQLQRSATEIAALLRRGRAEAALTGADASVKLDLKSRTVSASWTVKQLTLPADLAIRAVSARDGAVSTDKAVFHFLVDGSATGGSLQLKLKRSRLELGVDWLTGRVTQSELSS